MYGHPAIGYMPGYKPRKNSSIPDAVCAVFASPKAIMASLKPASVTHAEVGFFSFSTAPVFFGGDVVAPSETPVDRSADSRLGLKNGR